LPSSKQRAALTSYLDPPPRPRHLPHLQSLPIDERGGGSPHVIIAEPHPLMQQLRLHAASPPSTRRPDAEKRRASTEGNVVVKTRSNQRRLQEGHDVDKTPPSLVQDGPGFHPWKAMLGNTTPSAGDAAPKDVVVVKAFAQRVPQHKCPTKTRTLSCCRHRRHCPAIPTKPFQSGIDAPAARNSRIAASAATPSEQATQSGT